MDVGIGIDDLRLTNFELPDGTFNLLGDYSSAVVYAVAGPPPGEVWTVSRMIVHAVDVGGFGSDEYGNLGSPLANGIRLLAREQLAIELNDNFAGMTEHKFRCNAVRRA